MEHSVLHLDEWEIPRENIVINRKLGEGAFGAVCGGEVIGLTAEGDWVPVAVKSLKVGSLPEDKVFSSCVVVKLRKFQLLFLWTKPSMRLEVVSTQEMEISKQWEGLTMRTQYGLYSRGGHIGHRQ